MTTYNVVGSADRGFYVQGYPTGRTACCIETKRTTDQTEAQGWADRMNAGESVPEAQAAMYADD